MNSFLSETFTQRIPITNVSNDTSNSFEVTVHFYESDKKALSENIVLLPLTVLYEHNVSKVEIALRLSVIVNSAVSGEEATVLIMQVVSQLFNWNPSYSYNVSTPLQQFLLKMTGVKDSAVIVSVIAMVCLLLVILGLTGLIHLLFNRRKEGLSILIALGARRQELWVSMLIESMFPAIIGVGIGLVVGYFYLPKFVPLGQVVITPTVMGMILTAAGCLLPVLLSSSTLLLRIYRMNPIKILTRE
jgi:ABC-type antimicrobial peptide transport system permease subunit